jgi:hypothetical protein
LPTKRASERVHIWRKLHRYGALSLKSGGHLLPNTPANVERFGWLAASVRKFNGHACVMQVHSIDTLPEEKVKQLFVEERTRRYENLLSELKKKRPQSKHKIVLGQLRRRFQEIAEIDFFNSPLRSRVEAVLALADQSASPRQRGVRNTTKYRLRTWLTRPRPGIDRVSSAWLIRYFIDRDAKFIFDDDPSRHPNTIPFDTFTPVGFGHRGEDCTFETLCKEFGIRDARVHTIAQIIHDADLGDAKFGRVEGIGLDRTLIGWAQQGVDDHELLRRGIELIDGLYNSLP